jgi:hypothetical protein
MHTLGIILVLLTMLVIEVLLIDLGVVKYKAYIYNRFGDTEKAYQIFMNSICMFMGIVFMSIVLFAIFVN